MVLGNWLFSQYKPTKGRAQTMATFTWGELDRMIEERKVKVFALLDKVQRVVLAVGVMQKMSFDSENYRQDVQRRIPNLGELVTECQDLVNLCVWPTAEGSGQVVGEDITTSAKRHVEDAMACLRKLVGESSASQGCALAAHTIKVLDVGIRNIGEVFQYSVLDRMDAVMGWCRQGGHEEDWQVVPDALAQEANRLLSGIVEDRFITQNDLRGKSPGEVAREFGGNFKVSYKTASRNLGLGIHIYKPGVLGVRNSYLVLVTECKAWVVG